MILIFNQKIVTHRSSHRRCSGKKGVLRNFPKVTEKHLYQSLFFFWTCNFIKTRLWNRCFPVNFTKFLRTPSLIGHLRWLLLYSHIFTAKIEICHCKYFNRRFYSKLFSIVNELFINIYCHFILY